jgi:hypothetical protein
MNKIGSYQLLTLEEANRVDRYADRSFYGDVRHLLADLVLESRAERPPLTITAPDGSQIPVSPSQARRIDLRGSDSRVDL